MLLEDVVDPVYVGRVSQKLITALAAPFVIGGREYRVTASIGVSIYPDDGKDPETLLKHADIAMYRAKERGRNAYEFYSAHISSGSLERLSLEAGLRRALERDELSSVLSAADRDVHGSHRGHGGAGSLAPSRTGRTSTGTLHQAGRRKGFHRAARRVGAAYGMQGSPSRVAEADCARTHRRQSVATPVFARGAR